MTLTVAAIATTSFAQSFGVQVGGNIASTSAKYNGINTFFMFKKFKVYKKFGANILDIINLANVCCNFYLPQTKKRTVNYTLSKNNLLAF